MAEATRRITCIVHDCWNTSVGEADEAPDAQVCEYHFDLIGRLFFETRSMFGTVARDAFRAQAEANRATIEQHPPVPTAEDRSVVYYVRLGDRVKIGYTIHLPSRVSQLRVDRDMCLAAEPGWREQEAARHAEFAAERVGKREDFNPSRRLLAHIDAVRDEHGDPFELASRLANPTVEARHA